MAPALSLRSLSVAPRWLLAGGLYACATSAVTTTESTQPQVADELNADGMAAAGERQTDCAKPASMADQIVLDAPTPSGLVQSPLHIAGRARGGWYFEADFPVALYAADGTVLSQGVARAKGDWMTRDFVPFEVTLTFATPPSGGGWLVLVKDNPSDDRALDANLCVPVQF